jgi:hypothetical protein
MKVRRLIDQDKNLYGWAIYCPACESVHSFKDGMWSFNGDFEKPTFRPSLLVYEWPHEPELPGYRKQLRCHSVITDGNIHFEQDCGHNMMNLTVPLPDFPLNYME